MWNGGESEEGTAGRSGERWVEEDQERGGGGRDWRSGNAAMWWWGTPCCFQAANTHLPDSSVRRGARWQSRRAARAGQTKSWTTGRRDVWMTKKIHGERCFIGVADRRSAGGLAHPPLILLESLCLNAAHGPPQRLLALCSRAPQAVENGLCVLLLTLCGVSMVRRGM